MCFASHHSSLNLFFFGKKGFWCCYSPLGEKLRGRLPPHQLDDVGTARRKVILKLFFLFFSTSWHQLDSLFFISGRELLYYISFEKEQLILLDLLGQYTNNPNKAIRSEQLLGGYSTQLIVVSSPSSYTFGSSFQWYLMKLFVVGVFGSIMTRNLWTMELKRFPWTEY